MSNDIRVTIDLSKLREIRAAGGSQAVRRALGKLAHDVEANAKKAMEGQKSGRMYDGHQASAPGEAPAVDTGNLKNSIRAEAVGDGTREWSVNVGAEYGAGLEFGTPEIAPRPYMRPAAEETRQKIDDVFREEFKKL